MGEVIDPGFVVSKEERERLHAANYEACKFFRRELLQATGGWPLEYLRDRGLENVLTPGASWKIGYAPDSWSRLADHLQKQGFPLTTLVLAGLTSCTDDGAPIDRYRDQLMIVSRDLRLAPVGFVGIGRDGQVRSLTPATPLHRPSNVLVGLMEQIDLLSGGATVVIVDHPMDAIALEQLSRSTTKQYVGIPLCESPMSTAQARMLARYSETDRVILMVPTETESRQRAVGTSIDLAFFFDRIRVLSLPPGFAMSDVVRSPGGRQALVEYLASSKPLTGHGNGLNDNGTQHTSLGLEDPGPDLSP